ncbi:MAG: glycosyltransferase [Bellilinea sp.]|jgi:glycosyltransferase involved in cell wall biosynthesis
MNAPNGGLPAIPYRLGVQQRILPNYRAPFFEALGAACPRGLAVFAGLPRPSEAVEAHPHLENAHLYRAGNQHLLRGALYLCWQRGWRAWLNDWQPEVLVMEANPRYLSSPRLMDWMRARHRALVGWGLGAPTGGALAAVQRAAWRRFLARFDALLVYSRQGADQYARLGFDPARIFVAPNAVAARPIQPPPERPPGFPADRARVLYVGRLQARKRIDLLLRACAALPAPLQPDLWIVGDGPARRDLEQLAAGLYPAARFLGTRYGAQLDPYFAQADLFVLPGSGGLAVQQAMSFALPVIVAEADGTQSNLAGGQNGWLLPPGDLPALTDALQQALTDPARLRRMGLESYRMVREQVNLETMLAAFARAIHCAARRAGLAPPLVPPPDGEA